MPKNPFERFLSPKSPENVEGTIGALEGQVGELFTIITDLENAARIVTSLSFPMGSTLDVRSVLNERLERATTLSRTIMPAIDALPPHTRLSEPNKIRVLDTIATYRSLQDRLVTVLESLNEHKP